MVDLPGMRRLDAVVASVVSNCRSIPGSPGLRTYASLPGGPSKTSASSLQRARWNVSLLSGIGVIVAGAPGCGNVPVARRYSPPPGGRSPISPLRAALAARYSLRLSAGWPSPPGYTDIYERSQGRTRGASDRSRLQLRRPAAGAAGRADGHP